MVSILATERSVKNEHVLSGLIAKRAELAGRVETLQREMLPSSSAQKGTGQAQTRQRGPSRDVGDRNLVLWNFFPVIIRLEHRVQFPNQDMFGCLFRAGPKPMFFEDQKL
jgi:hypothetical protein